MDEQSKAALALLVQNGYLEMVKGKYRISSTLNDVIQKENKSFTLPEGGWEAGYVRFIQQCKIPRKGETGDGTLYDLNKYSDDAMKKFKQMIEKEGIQYDLLVKVTQAYYQGSNRYKKTITNFMLDGMWRLDYLNLKDQTTEQQQQTLQKQENESKPFTRDRIG